MTAHLWPLRLLTAFAVVALATRADAQQLQPSTNPGGVFRPQPQPKAEPKAEPKANPQKGQIIVHPQINTWPGIPASQFQPPAFNPGPFYNPALNNPYMNQTRFAPYNPFVNQTINNPFNTGFGPVSSYTPPLAIQQPGQFLYRGPDLQVNPWSGTTYRPLTGVVQTADGSTFYRVAGSGLPTASGMYSPGSGLYYNPTTGTFINPSSGVISTPGTTTVFLPWIP
jgi:hypothetical protein